MSEPKVIARQFLDALQNKDYPAWDALIAKDVVAHYPFAPDLMPSRFDGRDMWRDVTRQMFDNIGSFAFSDIECRATEDPEFVVVTARSAAEFLSGAHYDNQYVLFFRVRDGKVVEYWEHFNPLAIMKAFAPA